jgi:hypothetical protein
MNTVNTHTRALSRALPYFQFGWREITQENSLPQTHAAVPPMNTKMLGIVILCLLSFSTFAQGTLIFNNRTGNVDAPAAFYGRAWGDLPGGVAQLYLVGAAGVLTPLLPTATFRTTSPAAEFYLNQVTVTVPGIAPGSPATVRMRAWAGASSYETAIIRGESNDVTISQLGGIPPAGGAPIPDPILTGLQGFNVIPEPSITALWQLGAAALIRRRRK